MISALGRPGHEAQFKAMLVDTMGLRLTKYIRLSLVWWLMPYIPTFRKQRQVDLCESRAGSSI